MLRRKLLWSAAAVLAAMIGTGAQAADMGAKDKTIKLAMLEWTGQHVSTHIAGQILEKMGYKVEYVTAGNYPEFSGLADGSLDASVEVWMNNVGDIFPKEVAAKKPLVMMFWAPHYALAEADVGWVKMPPCKTQDNAHCITPPDVDKIVRTGFEKDWPAAYEFLKHFEVDAADQQQLMLRVDKKGENLDAVTKDWIDRHESVWQPWMKAAQS